MDRFLIISSLVIFSLLSGCAKYYEIQMRQIYFGNLSEEDSLKAYEPMANDGYAPAIEEIKRIKANREAWAKAKVEKEQRDAKAVEDEQKQLAAEQAVKLAVLEEKKQTLKLDEQKGYKHISLQDFILDVKSMQLSKKVALTGYYTLVGKIERINEYPTKDNFGNSVLIMTENAERNSRKTLLSDLACQQAYCPVIILGEVTRCRISIFSRNVSSESCVVVDEVRLNYN
jgi:hypothetical protein